MWQWILSLLSSPLLNKLADLIILRTDSSVRKHGADTAAAIAGVTGWLYAESKFRQTQAHYLSGMGWPATLIILGTAVPFVLHVGAITLDSTFSFGWEIPKLPAPYDSMEREILLSFFITAPAFGVIKAIAGIFKKS